MNTPKRVLLFAACSFLLGLMAAGCNVSADPSGNTEPTPTAPLSTQAPTEAPAPTGNYDGYPEIQPDGTLMLNSDDILTPLLDAPVTQAMRSENQIFCITESDSLMQLSLDGSSAVTLYNVRNQLRFLSCNGLLLYFPDGNSVIELMPPTAGRRFCSTGKALKTCISGSTRCCITGSVRSSTTTTSPSAKLKRYSKPVFPVRSPLPAGGKKHIAL